jgi:ribosomal protein S3AE
MAIKKTWFEIYAPKEFEEKLIGRTLSLDPDYLIGRVIESNTIDLFGDYSRFFVKVRLQIEKVNGKKAFTKFIGHTCLSDRIYRMVRKHTKKIEAVLVVETKDKKNIRIKTVIVVAGSIPTTLKRKIRTHVKEFIEKESTKTNLKDLAKSMIDGQIQRKISEKCKSLYPIAGVEIRKSEVLGESLKQEAKRKRKKEYTKSEGQKGKKKKG